MNLRIKNRDSWPVTAILGVLLMVCLSGCYSGTVKPLVDRAEFRAENQPVRTLKIWMVTDGSYREEEIENLVSKCSHLMELQVGIRLEIVGSQRIKWGEDKDDSSAMLARIAVETWEETDHFDMAIAFAHFEEKSGPYQLYIGRIDGIFWRYVVVKELEPTLLLHEIVHAFLVGKEHSEDWLMRPTRSQYGSEWYWLTPEERKEVLQSKWRDFNVVPPVGDDKRGTTKVSGFHYYIGRNHVWKKEYSQAIKAFEKSIEADPDYARPRNSLAWLLATVEEKGLRDGNKAVELALRACELTEWKVVRYVDTLAAAYARAGDFDEAIRWQEKALESMQSYAEGAKRAARERLRLYRERKPVPVE